jgi:hypothetical protein
MAERERREAMIASELQAREKDASNPKAQAELDLWDETLGDGID